MTDGKLDELRLLARLHYGLAALTALFPLLLLPVFVTGVDLLRPADLPPPTSPSAAAEAAETRVWREVLGKLAVGGVAAITAICLVHAAVLWYIGRVIAARRRWWLAMIFSALHLINIPLGTALGIFAFLALGRPEAKREFGVARVAG